MCLAIPGKVEQIWEEAGARMGKVNFGGIVKEVCLAYLPEIAVGDYTIVHVGFALSKIDEESARASLQAFRDLGLLDEEFASEEQVLKQAAEQGAPECPSCKAAEKQPA
ncbi:MAG: HypC/HybG/HupF family hydrogenase formation chaperone [Acidobacteriia bacterium]|nr:HypC/HybG/HupF family hydrogenase formation chaperone [Terriglobia bacterium]